MDKFKKVGKIVLNTVLAIVMIAIMVIVVCNIVMNIQKSHGSKTPNIFGYASLCIEDNYMSPDVKEGDFVMIEVTMSVKEGDLLTFISSNNTSYETQKIVGIVYDDNHQYIRQYIVAKSDGAQSVVLPTRVYGKVVSNFHGLAPVIKFFNSVPGTSLLIALALIVIFFPDISALFKRDKKKNDRGDKEAGETAEETSLEQ